MFETLLFDFQFLNPGDGDWLEVHFNNSLLASFNGLLFGATLRTHYLDLSAYSGQQGTLTFLLVSAGAAPAKVRLENIRYAGLSETGVSEVPLPSSIGFLVFPLLALFVLKSRHFVSIRPATLQDCHV